MPVTIRDQASRCEERPKGLELQARLNELASRGADGVCDFVSEILAEGIRRGASDIHIEPGADRVTFRLRLDGVLHPGMGVRTPIPANIVARVKVLADLLTYQTDVPQEGRINREKAGAQSDLRVSTFPTVHGEKVVIRLFDPMTQGVRLEDLGYPESLLAALQRQLQMPRGVILFTGPAGSGKTTTIYAALKYILDQTGSARNIVTVEDPVERVLPGVTQTQVHPATGLTFARCLRSLMRQDPEVIVIGEIRDRETAEIAVEAGLTGHLVISTIHSGTAAGVLTRLLNMKVEPYLIASSVTFTAAQRLVRKLCLACRQRITRPGDLLGLSSDLLGAAYGPVGCEACFRTGYAGRTVIVECLATSRAIWDRIIEHAAGEALEAVAEEGGMVPLRQAAVQAVKAGITSPAEIRRVFGPE